MIGFEAVGCTVGDEDFGLKLVGRADVGFFVVGLDEVGFDVGVRVVGSCVGFDVGSLVGFLVETTGFAVGVLVGLLVVAVGLADGLVVRGMCGTRGLRGIVPVKVRLPSNINCASPVKRRYQSDGRVYPSASKATQPPAG